MVQPWIRGPFGDGREHNANRALISRDIAILFQKVLRLLLSS
jgi:hypothetical protein